MLCYIILYYIILFYFILRYIMLCYVMFCFVLFCVVLLCCVVLCYNNLMGPPSYIRSVVDQNVVIQHMTILAFLVIF